MEIDQYYNLVKFQHRNLKKLRERAISFTRQFLLIPDPLFESESSPYARYDCLKPAFDYFAAKDNHCYKNKMILSEFHKIIEVSEV